MIHSVSINILKTMDDTKNLLYNDFGKPCEGHGYILKWELYIFIPYSYSRQQNIFKILLVFFAPSRY